MSIAATDLKAYGCANSPEVDTTTGGGAVDTNRVLTFTASSDTDAGVALEALSSVDSTLQLTSRFRTNAGALKTTTITLNATTPVQIDPLAVRYERGTVSGTDGNSFTIRVGGGGATHATI